MNSQRMSFDSPFRARPNNDGKTRPCEGCGFEDPQFRHTKKEALTGRYYEECEKCFDATIPQHPDVYCPQGGYFDPLLGVHFNSKAHKAYYLKQRGWREAGDTVRGARSFDPISYKHAMKSMERRTYGIKER